MAERRPLAIVSGVVRELPVGDVLPSGLYIPFRRSVKTGAYTLLTADFGGNHMIVMDSASAVALTLNTGVVAAEPLLVCQYGAGQVTLGGSATLHNRNGLKTAGQYALFSIIPLGTDEYVISGDVAL